jgi:urease accessory protein
VKHRRSFQIIPAVTVLVALPLRALAHAEGASAGAGFLTGFSHPLGGLDHVLAMLAVGMWGAQLGKPSIWVLPVAFPQIMALGGVAGILGLPLPAIEIGVTLSVITLGSMIAFDQRPPLWAASLLVGFLRSFRVRRVPSPTAQASSAPRA